MAEYKGIAYLRRKLIEKRSRVLTRYAYYDMKNVLKDLGISTPPNMRNLTETLGWCGKAVDSIADRLQFYGFEEDNFDMGSIFQMNNQDVLPDSAMLAALIGSCSFIYISQDTDGYPRMQVIDGSNATGIMDPITGLLTEGYAVLQRDENDKVLQEAYFIPGMTIYYQNGKEVDIYENDALYPLLVPVVHRPDATRPFGHSRISRACMSIMQSALRTLKRSEITAEYYSFPQKYILGLSPEADPIDKWSASISSLLEITRDEEGGDPKVGQFTQQNMSPHVEQLRMWASAFAGETGLTLDDLGFVTDNPSSAEAIKASHENLRLAARKAQRNFGTGFLNAGYLAACVRDEYPYQRQQIYLTKPLWEPVFEPDSAMLSSIGDGAIKINQAVPGYFGANNLRKLTGIQPNT